MSFTWPLGLLLLLAPLLLIAMYLWALRRRRKVAIRWSSIAFLREAMPHSSPWRRHVHAVLLLLGLIFLVFASARPTVLQDIAIGRTSIILALDVSRSMCATDIEPNRLSAAQEAAVAYVRAQPTGTRIGIVAFSGFAEITVAPTTDREGLVAAIEGLTTGRGTAIGAALLKSLDAIADVNADVAPVGDMSSAERADTAQTQAPAGEFVADIVVLLTDGRNTRGVEPDEAVPQAVERRVRVYTIGFGTTQPAAMACTAQQLGAAAFGGGFGARPGGGANQSPGGGPGGNAVVADEASLQNIARSTGGTYHNAADAEELQAVFEELPKDVEHQKERREITWVFAGLGALFAAASLAASARWSAFP